MVLYCTTSHELSYLSLSFVVLFYFPRSALSLQYLNKAAIAEGCLALTLCAWHRFTFQGTVSGLICCRGWTSSKRDRATQCMKYTWVTSLFNIVPQGAYKFSSLHEHERLWAKQLRHHDLGMTGIVPGILRQQSVLVLSEGHPFLRFNFCCSVMTKFVEYLFFQQLL